MVRDEGTTAYGVRTALRFEFIPQSSRRPRVQTRECCFGDLTLEMDIHPIVHSELQVTAN